MLGGRLVPRASAHGHQRVIWAGGKILEVGYAQGDECQEMPCALGQSCRWLISRYLDVPEEDKNQNHLTHTDEKAE